MKINLTLDLDVKMGVSNLTGTGLAGYMPEGTTYKQMVSVFGKPQRGESPDGKVHHIRLQIARPV